MNKKAIKELIENEHFINYMNNISKDITNTIIPINFSIDNKTISSGKSGISIGIPDFFYKDIYKPWDISYAIKGFVIHESEHIVSSNYKVFIEYQKKIYKYYITKYPEFLTELMVEIGARLNNALEDGRIELINSIKYPHNAKILKYVNSLFFREQLIKNVSNKPQERLYHLLLAIAYVATINRTPQNWEFTYQDEAEGQIIDDIWSDINKARISDTHEELSIISFDILKKIEKYVEKLISDVNYENNEQNIKEELKNFQNQINNNILGNINKKSKGTIFKLNKEDRIRYDNLDIDINKLEDIIKKDFKTNIEEKKARNCTNSEMTSYKDNIYEIKIIKENLTAIKSQETKDEYLFRKEIDTILNKKQRKKLKNKNSGIIETNLLSNISFSNSLFYKIKKGKKLDIAISILIDSSGSMEGNKIQLAHKTCTILEKVLSSIIKLKIIYYNTNEENNHIIIKEFNENIQEKSLNAAYTPIANGGNKESLHLVYEIDSLALRKEKDKFIIILSDGLPSMYNTIEEGVIKVREAVDYGKKLGINIICIAIEENHSNIIRNRDIFAQMYNNVILSEDKLTFKYLSNLIKKIIN